MPDGVRRSCRSSDLIEFRSLYDVAVKPKKVLLISSAEANKTIDRLKRANSLVMEARDGESALALAKHVPFDVAVLISTGDVMGRTETALNLRDIRPFSEIILVTRDRSKPTQGETAVKKIPNTRVLTLKELEDYLAPSSL
jgi:PleD family two-component response regulator